MQHRYLQQPLSLILLGSALVLTGCGGSSGEKTSNSDSANSLVPVGGSNTSADNLSTEDIQRSAADSMSRMLTLSSSELVATLDPESDSPLNESVAGDDTLVSDDLNTSLIALLGLNEGDIESVTREGNVVTIDLAENAICDDQGDDQASCLAAVQHISVAIDAASDDSGVVSYLYRSQPAIRIGYAPNAGSYELRLDPWLTFLIDQRQFIWPDGDSPAFPESFSGALRISIEADTEFPNELGSMGLSLTEPMSIQSTVEGLSIEAEAAELWSVGMTETGGFFEFNTGAASITLASNEDDNQMTDFASSGFTGRADIRSDNGLLTVSNFGMSNGPITLTVDSGDVVQLALETFGFTVAEVDNEVVLTGDLNLSVLVSNVMSNLPEDSSAFEFMLDTLAPSGSAFSPNGDGSTQLLRGGPFTVSFSETDEMGTSQSNVVVDAGSCFDSASNSGGGSSDDVESMDESDASNLIELVDCPSDQ